MNQKETPKSKTSIRTFYLWSLGLVVVGFGLLLLIKYWTATTFCPGSQCDLVDTVGVIGRPIGAILFFAGVGLFVGGTIRHLALRRRG